MLVDCAMLKTNGMHDAPMPEDEAAGMDRRDFLRYTALTGTAVAVGGLGILAFRAAVPEPDPEPEPLLHPDTGEPVRPSDLEAPAPLLLHATFRGEPALVLKLSLVGLRAAAEARGYDTGQFAVRHPTDPEAALLAYDGRCTHLGCTVGWNDDLPASGDVADYDGDGHNDGRALCPCHASQFDVYDLAANVPGTPAPRPLDAIPVRLADVAGDLNILGLRRIRQDRPRAADERGAGAAFSL